MVKKANPLVKKVNPDTQDCGCAFLIDENGVPTVECPTNEAQALAFAALQRNPDVQIRVVASVALEDADDLVDSDTDDFEDELELEEDDFGDDLEDLDEN